MYQPNRIETVTVRVYSAYVKITWEVLFHFCIEIHIDFKLVRFQVTLRLIYLRV